MHYVKCYYCQQQFDRDKESFVQVSAKRYAHKECAKRAEEQKTQEEKDKESLEKFILELFNIPCLTVKIKNQIKKYHNEDNYSYSGILKTLIYWFQIKGNSIEQANNGIGIVQYLYKEASQYYYNLYLAQTLNNDKNIQNYKTKIKTVIIPAPQIKKKKPRLFFEGEL